MERAIATRRCKATAHGAGTDSASPQGADVASEQKSAQAKAEEVLGVAQERSATSVDRRLGQRVRARRLEIGMSQERLADLLGVTFQQVQKYEKGVNRIAASRLVDIAAALDLPVPRFFEGLGAGKAKAGESAMLDVMSTPEGTALLTIFASIKNRRVRLRVIDLVRALAESTAR
jgi:transcriptional regulator with XRE-family HTH domain